ncbi:TIGR00297 family protein [Mucilaginibacter sp.]|jgi:uncharacterized protein (TIGR00297 family)|uniref:DUF92 domain-containing protein n=1 Tax=Mucilaginibacter sp. TaxID=1882438 RepID=UPI00356A0D9B
MSTPVIIFLILLFAAMFASYKANKLTPAGTLTGGVVALAIFAGAGFTGIGMLAAFFVLSVLATSHKKAEKRKIATDKHHPEKRNAGQVLANGGIAAIMGLLAYQIPSQTILFTVLTAAALASATADTLSSELGMVYGRRFYNIINFKPDEKGRDGVISLEGTLIGIAGSVVIAVIYAIGFGWGNTFFYIIIAGTMGNITDSILGATLERKAYLNNDAVNFLNTALSVLTCWLLILI